MKNWKEKAFFLLKKSRISIAELLKIYKSYTRVLNFIKYRDPYFFVVSRWKFQPHAAVPGIIALTI